MPDSPQIAIVEDSSAAGEIQARLLTALRSALPQSRNTGFTLVARDKTGALVGGLSAGTSYGWLLVKTLWVAEPHRGGGLGCRLMEEAEARGRDLGCHAAWLDTSSPGARRFYGKLGYLEFGVLENAAGQCPPTHRRWFLTKTF